MLLPILVLSPHRDDAVFSLAHALRHWHSLPVRVLVLNVYTVSTYAPRAFPFSNQQEYAQSQARLSALRKREDRAALRFVAASTAVFDLGLSDAPLQFGADVMAVSGPHAIAAANADVNALASRLRPLLHRGRVVAPLGLGNHVNHLLVKRAALRCVPAHRLAFYEDLPYAAWTTATEWQARLTEAGRGDRQSLRSRVCHCGSTTYWKARAAAHYQTQISEKDARAVADFGRRYDAGERLWIPRHSREWNAGPL